MGKVGGVMPPQLETWGGGGGRPPPPPPASYIYAMGVCVGGSIYCEIDTVPVHGALNFENLENMNVIQDHVS